jgi:hypothetical protein
MLELGHGPIIGNLNIHMWLYHSVLHAINIITTPPPLKTGFLIMLYLDLRTESVKVMYISILF